MREGLFSKGSDEGLENEDYETENKLSFESRARLVYQKLRKVKELELRIRLRKTLKKFDSLLKTISEELNLEIPGENVKENLDYMLYFFYLNLNKYCY